jgi:hypothetical protein
VAFGCDFQVSMFQSFKVSRFQRQQPCWLRNLETSETLKLGVSPSPSIYWNLGVGGKLAFDPWAAMSYGQNLEPE